MGRIRVTFPSLCIHFEGPKSNMTFQDFPNTLSDHSVTQELLYILYYISIQSFKYHQKMASTRNLKIPSYYFYGKRRLISVLHARMSTNCSNLNSDLFNNFLRPDPICSCQTELFMIKESIIFIAHRPSHIIRS